MSGAGNNMPKSDGSDNLTWRQRTLLKYYEELNDMAQLVMIDMAEEFAGMFPRRLPSAEMAGGVA